MVSDVGVNGINGLIALYGYEAIRDKFEYIKMNIDKIVNINKSSIILKIIKN